jgi:23S rRNA pseudoU1915 N3-methylase RlmH
MISGNIMVFICPHLSVYVYCEGYRQIVKVTGSKDQEKDKTLQSDSCTIHWKISELIFPHFLVYVVYCEGYREIVWVTGSKDQV